MQTRYPLLIIDIALLSLLIFLPNTLMGMNLMRGVTEHNASQDAHWYLLINTLKLSDCLAWALTNGVLLFLLVALRRPVLAYANYLEDKIARQTLDPSVRYDFDDVSESSFNLKLIAGALSLIQTPDGSAATPLNIPLLIEQTMLALAPSLDRRNMNLTTLEVDLAVKAMGNATIIVHVLWMLLLGTIRYAADESTLRLRCLYNRDRSRALLSIVISELSLAA